MKVELVIDRFEGARAVLLCDAEGSVINWPKEMLPEDAREGDVLAITIKKDRKATEKALAATEKLLRELLQQA